MLVSNGIGSWGNDMDVEFVLHIPEPGLNGKACI